MSNGLTKPTDVECKGDLKAFERNRYFYGKLLTVRDFETEQRYFIDKHRLINRLIHGSGVACGLMVSMKSGSNTTVTIESGVALDCCGREIVVPVAQDIDLSKENIFTTQPAAYIVLKYDWCGKEKVPNVSDVSSCEETCCYSRIMESYKIEVVKDKPEECIVFDEKFCGNMENFIKNPDDAEARKKLLDAWQKCATIGSDPAVNLAFVKKEGSSFTIDNTARTLLYSNPILYEVMKCHLNNLENPHNVTAGQVRALQSINNVGNVVEKPNVYVKNIDLVSDGGIKIEPDSVNNKITIKTTPANMVNSVGLTKCSGTSLSFAPGDHIHDLEDGIVAFQKLANELQEQLKTVFMYLRERALKCTVLNFKDVARKFNSERASKLSSNCKTFIDNKQYVEEDTFLEAMKGILGELQKMIEEEIEKSATEESLKGFSDVLKSLENAISQKDSLKIATAQDEVCFYAMLLEPEKAFNPNMRPEIVNMISIEKYDPILKDEATAYILNALYEKDKPMKEEDIEKRTAVKRDKIGEITEKLMDKGIISKTDRGYIITK